MVKWQTHRLEGAAPVRACEFKSRSGHNIPTTRRRDDLLVPFFVQPYGPTPEFVLSSCIHKERNDLSRCFPRVYTWKEEESLELFEEDDPKINEGG